MERPLDEPCTVPGGSVTVVELHGDLDLDTADMLRDCLEDGVERGTDIVVDLADVTLIDCVSLGALVEAGRLAERRGHQLCLAAPQPAIRRTLAATMLDKVFRQYPDRRRAVGGLSAGCARS
ncbi:STAS domain-containing protein [Actinoplanes sp. NPDC048967]|uniref:STAS domain-containing protein n=1 Tax=Actinoplanes sp. NPDC048967 TaxID=3155269 RepID=UPI0033C98760